MGNPKSAGINRHVVGDERALQSIRESYDRIADEYALRIFNEHQHKPLDRDLLNRFAAEIAERGQVCDMGCGPGHVARYLRDAGTIVFGLDLSEKMLEQARRLNPDISFRQGNMMALDLEDRTLAGIAAFYAIVNISNEFLPLVFREMNRLLRPGGLLLLAFHTGDEVLHMEEFWGRAISMDFFLFQPSQIRRYLAPRFPVRTNRPGSELNSYPAGALYLDSSFSCLRPIANSTASFMA